MSRFSFGKRHDPQVNAVEVPEDPVVRQYRYLLRTASADALEAAQTEAIPLLPEADQALLLETLQSSLLVGDHLTTKDHAKIAHLMTSAERRSPGQLLTALPPEVIHVLAAAVLGSEASFGLLRGYPQWDGVEPQAPDNSAYEGDGFDPNAGHEKVKRPGADGGAAFGRLP